MKLTTLKKKGGVFDSLGAMAVGIATLAITLVVAFLIISQGQTQIADIENIADPTNVSQRTTAYNATVTLAEATDDIPGWVPLVVIAGIGAVLLGLVAAFKGRN